MRLQQERKTFVAAHSVHSAHLQSHLLLFPFLCGMFASIDLIQQPHQPHQHERSTLREFSQSEPMSTYLQRTYLIVFSLIEISEIASVTIPRNGVHRKSIF